MFEKQKWFMILSAMALPASVIGAESIAVATQVEKILYALRSPFLIFLEREGWGSILVGILLFIYVVGIESYVTCRLLQKKCTVIVARMLGINLIEQVVQNIIFFGAVVAVFMISIQTSIVVSAVFELLFVLLLFYARVIISSTLFSWFDPSIDRAKLKKTMLLANGLSYLFLLTVMQLSMLL